MRTTDDGMEGRASGGQDSPVTYRVLVNVLVAAAAVLIWVLGFQDKYLTRMEYAAHLDAEQTNHALLLKALDRTEGKLDWFLEKAGVGTFPPDAGMPMRPAPTPAPAAQQQ